jgi:Sec7-like guanine-nucleotide exchange factor
VKGKFMPAGSESDRDYQLYLAEQEKIKKQKADIAAQVEKPISGIQARIDRENLKKKMDEEIAKELEDTNRKK